MSSTLENVRYESLKRLERSHLVLEENEYSFLWNLANYIDLSDFQIALGLLTMKLLTLHNLLSMLDEEKHNKTKVSSMMRVQVKDAVIAFRKRLANSGMEIGEFNIPKEISDDQFLEITTTLSFAFSTIDLELTAKILLISELLTS